MSYSTADDLKTRLNISGSQDDALLSDLIDAVDEWIDRYCNRPRGAFAVAVDSTRYYGSSAVCDQVLTLDSTILSVTTLTNGDGVALSSGAYRLHPRNEERHYQIRLLSTYAWNFPDLDSEITVVGAFGYSADAPAPVREASLHFAGWQFKRYQAALQDASVNFELGQIRYSKKVPETVLALLDQYVDRSKLL